MAEILKNLPQYDIRRMPDGSWVVSAAFATKEEAAAQFVAFTAGGISPLPEETAGGIPDKFWYKSPEFKMGWSAFEHILSDAANPYRDDSPQSIEWFEGYCAAERWVASTPMIYF
jgi:hypothetical protein